MKKILSLTIIIAFAINGVRAQAPVQPKNMDGGTVRKYQAVTAILGAFPAEVALIHDLILNKKEITFQNIQFTEGMLNGRHVVLAQTGIGKVNAAIATTLMLEHFEPGEV